jgi:hypothetical protein
MDLILDLDQKISRLKQLKRLKVIVRSQGRYPVKSRTLVADVCRYQNDGTPPHKNHPGISPSKFIERAEAAADAWQDEMDLALSRYLEDGENAEFEAAAKKIAADISVMCDRVKTGRLKASFEGEVK